MMLYKQSRLHSVDKSVNNKLILFRDFIRYTRLAFVEMVEWIQRMFYNSIIYVNIAVGNLYIALQHINWRFPSATHVACFLVAYISSPMYLFIFLFFHFNSSTFDFNSRISSKSGKYSAEEFLSV
jgi:hypothetical protein